MQTYGQPVGRAKTSVQGNPQGAGLNGKRSGLFFTFMGLAREIRPSWFLLENVPGPPIGG